MTRHTCTNLLGPPVHIHLNAKQQSPDVGQVAIAIGSALLVAFHVEDAGFQ